MVQSSSIGRHIGEETLTIARSHVRVALATLDRVNLTDEQLRYAHHYQPGRIVEIARPIDGQRLPPGLHTVQQVDSRGRVTLRGSDGKDRQFRPIAMHSRGDTRLLTQQNFLVSLTRVREALTLVVDQTGSVAGKIARSTGEKASALEATGKLDSKADGRKPPLEKSLELTPAPIKPFEIGI